MEIPEIRHLIIAYLSDRQDILACAQTCHKWMRYMLYYLWSDLKVFGYSDECNHRIRYSVPLNVNRIKTVTTTSGVLIKTLVAAECKTLTRLDVRFDEMFVQAVNGSSTSHGSNSSGLMSNNGASSSSPLMSGSSSSSSLSGSTNGGAIGGMVGSSGLDGRNKQQQLLLQSSGALASCFPLIGLNPQLKSLTFRLLKPEAFRTPSSSSRGQHQGSQKEHHNHHHYGHHLFPSHHHHSHHHHQQQQQPQQQSNQHSPQQQHLAQYLSHERQSSARTSDEHGSFKRHGFIKSLLAGDYFGHHHHHHHNQQDRHHGRNHSSAGALGGPFNTNNNNNSNNNNNNISSTSTPFSSTSSSPSLSSPSSPEPSLQEAVLGMSLQDHVRTQLSGNNLKCLKISNFRRQNGTFGSITEEPYVLFLLTHCRQLEKLIITGTEPGLMNMMAPIIQQNCKLLKSLSIIGCDFLLQQQSSSLQPVPQQQQESLILPSVELMINAVLSMTQFIFTDQRILSTTIDCLLFRHGNTLTVVDLASTSLHSYPGIHQIVFRCPKLKVFTGRNIVVEVESLLLETRGGMDLNLEQDQYHQQQQQQQQQEQQLHRSWVCTELEQLTLMIRFPRVIQVDKVNTGRVDSGNGYSQHYHQHQQQHTLDRPFFQQLSALRYLKSISLWFFQRGADMTLGNGLEELDTLKDLQELNLSGSMTKPMGEKEERWLAQYWPHMRKRARVNGERFSFGLQRQMTLVDEEEED